MFAAQPLLDSSASPLEILAMALHQRAERIRRLTAAVRAEDRDGAVAAAKSVDRSRGAVDEAWAVVRAGLPPPPEAVGLLRELLMQGERADLDLRQALQLGRAKDLDGWLSARAPFDPVKTVDAMLADGEFEPLRDLVLAVGPRCAGVIEDLSRRGQRRVLWLASEGAAVRADLGETQVLRAKDPEAVEESTWSVVNPAPASVRCVAPPGTDRVLIEDGMRRALEVLRLRAVFEAFAKRYGMDLVRRGLRNAHRVASLPNAGALDEALRGEAAVIVAAGPSLDKNIHLLKEMQGKVAILAMNQTVRALRRAGIRPDIVLAGDWGNLTPHFEGVEPGEIGALGLSTVVTPALFDVPAEQRFVFAASPWIERWLFDMLGDNATLHARGSVSFSLLELALRMGCHTVAFIGLDLAFDGTRYYARGAADGDGELEARGDGTVSMRTMADTKMKLAASGQEEDLRRILDAQYRVQEVPGWHGGTVGTMADLHAQLVAMRAHVREAQGRARLVNATEGGAFIEGMEHIALAELLRSLPVDADAAEGRIRDRIRARLSAVDGPRRVETLRRELSKVNDGLPKLIDAVQVTQRELARLGHRVDDTPAYRKARARWSERARGIPVEHFLSVESARVVEDALTAKNMSVATLRRAEREVFARYREAAEDLADAVREALPALATTEATPASRV